MDDPATGTEVLLLVYFAGILIAGIVLYCCARILDELLKPRILTHARELTHDVRYGDFV